MKSSGTKQHEKHIQKPKRAKHAQHSVSKERQAQHMSGIENIFEL